MIVHERIEDVVQLPVLDEEPVVPERRIYFVVRASGDHAVQFAHLCRGENDVGRDADHCRAGFDACEGGCYPAAPAPRVIRNFEGLDKGLAEMCRVLKTGGHLVILELSTPDRLPMKQLFTIYSKVVIPLLGKCLSKDNSAYTYLPQSIRAFPQGEVMQEVIRKAGFSQVNFRRLTFGICTLYTATK